MSWGAQNRSKDAKTPNIGPAMTEKPIFYQLFNKLTPQPARPADLKHAHRKPGINMLSAGRAGATTLGHRSHFGQGGRFCDFC
jgi:hypothetical protein